MLWNIIGLLIDYNIPKYAYRNYGFAHRLLDFVKSSIIFIYDFLWKIHGNFLWKIQYYDFRLFL